MSSQPKDYLSAIKNMNQFYQSIMIIAFIFIILIIIVVYIIYLTRLKSAEVSYMNRLYSKADGNIKPIAASDPDCSGNLYDYYIKTAYNACSGGSYKNDFVDINILKTIINQGVRCLDFEIYSINDQPVVSSSTSDDYYVKETFNSVSFGDVMKTIKSYAFA